MCTRFLYILPVKFWGRKAFKVCLSMCPGTAAHILKDNTPLCCIINTGIKSKQGDATGTWCWRTINKIFKRIELHK